MRYCAIALPLRKISCKCAEFGDLLGFLCSEQAISSGTSPCKLSQTASFLHRGLTSFLDSSIDLTPSTSSILCRLTTIRLAAERLCADCPEDSIPKGLKNQKGRFDWGSR